MSLPPAPLPAVSRYELVAVAELETAELLLIGTLRLSLLQWRDPEGEHPDWRGGFETAEIAEDAVPAFDALLRIIAATARRRLDLRCRHCPALGADELRLLRILALMQRERDADAAALLADCLPPVALRMAMLPARGLAMALLQGGLLLPLRETTAMAATAPPCDDRGLALLH
jgi:hypothetical protein